MIWSMYGAESAHSNVAIWPNIINPNVHFLGANKTQI